MRVLLVSFHSEYILKGQTEWSLPRALGMQNFQALHVNKIPKWSVCPLKLEKQHFNASLTEQFLGATSMLSKVNHLCSR